MMVNSWIRIFTSYWNTGKNVVINPIPQILNNQKSFLDRSFSCFSTAVE